MAIVVSYPSAAPIQVSSRNAMKLLAQDKVRRAALGGSSLLEIAAGTTWSRLPRISGGWVRVRISYQSGRSKRCMRRGVIEVRSWIMGRGPPAKDRQTSR
jgi:hypothetical protein